MVTLKAVYSLFLSDLQAVSSAHPTPVATCGKVPCGVALLLVLAQFCDLYPSLVANHWAGL